MSIEINVGKTRLKKLIRTTKLIPRHLLAREAELMVAKWPAYRFLSPLEATKLFHAEYVKAYKTYYTTNIDYEEGQRIRIGLKLRYLMQNAHLTQVWKARQLADELGMPYPDYLEFVFAFAADRQRQRPPATQSVGPEWQNPGGVVRETGGVLDAGALCAGAQQDGPCAAICAGLLFRSSCAAQIS